MLYLKLLLELSALVGIALLIRHFVFGFRKLNKGLKARHYAGEWQWYTAIFFSLGIIFSIIAFWSVYGLFYLFHSFGHYQGVMVVQQGALLVPALILGFYGSSVFSKVVYLDFFGMNPAIFEEDGSTTQYKIQRIFQRIFRALTLSVAVLLLTFQFRVYLKTDGERIYVRNMGGPERVYSLEDIRKVSAVNAHDLEIYLVNGEKLSTGQYSGNLNYFLDHISQ